MPTLTITKGKDLSKYSTWSLSIPYMYSLYVFLSIICIPEYSLYVA